MKNRASSIGLIKFVLSLLCSISVCLTVSAREFQSDDTTRAGQESEFDSKRREGLSENPPDISFSIRLEGGKKQFRLGEAIRLEMSFASSSAKTYTMNTATYDRSGRLRMDKFHIEPESGFTDPLRDHMNFIGGGLSGVHELDEKPYLMTYEINEWFRFDEPGKYRLYLTSPRVSRIGKRGEPNTITLTSNAVEFEVVKAEPGWREKELQRIVKEIDAEDRNRNRRTACRALRFLGSKESVPEMVRRYGDSNDDCAFEYYAGLIGSPHREFVIETMETQIAAPDQPVPDGWLHLLIRLAVSSQLRQPPSGDDRQWSEYWRRYRELYEQIQSKYAGRLAQSVHLKTGGAKGVSVIALLNMKGDKTKLPDAASFFNDLPRQEQRTMLEYRWKQIAGDSMLPALRQLYAKRPDGKTEESYERTEIKTLALKRIYELSPEEGRQLIIAAMSRPDPRVGLQALTALPDETLPELDHVFVDNFEKGQRTEVHSALIERYGSPNIHARVRSLLDERIGRMACYEQMRLLAYCLRVDAPGSIEMIRRAINEREKTRCYTGVLTGVADLHMSPELEKLAIEYLDDADVEAATNAVALLGKHGSADAEEPLWRKFEEWRREWSGREEEFEADIFNNEPIRLQLQIERELRTALSNSPAWLADPKKLERIKQLCVTQNQRQEVDRSIQEWGSEISIRFSPAGEDWGRASLVHYELDSLNALKKKLAQFPKGSVFKWQPYNEGHLEGEKEKLFRELESFIGELGLKLVK